MIVVGNPLKMLLEVVNRSYRVMDPAAGRYVPFDPAKLVRSSTAVFR